MTCRKCSVFFLHIRFEQGFFINLHSTYDRTKCELTGDNIGTTIFSENLTLLCGNSEC